MHNSDILDKPAGYLLECFCARIQNTFRDQGEGAPTPEQIASELRQFYPLSIPVRPQLSTLINKFDISLSVRVLPEILRGCNHYNPSKKKWQIFIPPGNMANEAITILHELYEIIYARCCHRIPWWEERMLKQGFHGSHDGADRFAYAVAIPPEMFKRKARLLGLNPWLLSREFGVSPALCARKVPDHVQLPTAMFQVGLKCFTPEPDPLNFLDTSYSFAEVAWNRNRDIVSSSNSAAIHELLEVYPEQHSFIKIRGMLHRAFVTGRTVTGLTEEIYDVELPEPVFVAIRPNPNTWRPGEIFVQAVAPNYGELLLSAATG